MTDTSRTHFIVLSNDFHKTSIRVLACISKSPWEVWTEASEHRRAAWRRKLCGCSASACSCGVVRMSGAFEPAPTATAKEGWR